MKKLLYLAPLLVVLWGCSVEKLPPNIDRASAYFFKTTKLIMTSKERKEFLSLKTKDERAIFINQFWAKRFPDPGDREAMVRLYYQRVANAIAWFSERYKAGYETDRGEIYILLGLPERIETFNNLPDVDAWDADNLSLLDMFYAEETKPYGATIQDWVYYRYNFVIRFIKRTPEDEFHYTASTMQLMPIIRGVSPFTKIRSKYRTVEVGYKNGVLTIKIYYNFLLFKKINNSYKAYVNVYLRNKEKYYKLSLTITLIKNQKFAEIKIKNLKFAPSMIVVKDKISERIEFISLKK